MKTLFNVLSSTLASSVRLWSGTSAEPAAVRPEQPLELYDIEACPYCRPVREMLTELDLEAMIYPCPNGGKRFSDRVEEMGGKKQFPYLVDVNTGVRMYESKDIIGYLFDTYGQRKPPLSWRIGAINPINSTLASLARGVAGMQARPSKAPETPLELYSFESSPFCRIVRECLCELEIPYLLHNVGHIQWADYVLPPIRERFLSDVPAQGASQEAFVARSGKMMVPYLVDPNTGVEMFESVDIKKYLLQTYGFR